MYDLKDKILAQKIRSGNEEAFRVIYDRYHAQMYFVAKKYFKDSALAEDAVQDIFLKIWDKRESLDDAKSLKGFLFTMLKNHVLNMIRNRKKQSIPITKLKTDRLPKSRNTEEEITYKEYHRIVENGVSKLSNRKKEVFELKAYGGFSNTKIAEMLKINVRTVKTHYYHSSKFIRAYLKKHSGIILTVFIFKHILISIF